MTAFSAAFYGIYVIVQKESENSAAQNNMKSYYFSEGQIKPEAALNNTDIMMEPVKIPFFGDSRLMIRKGTTVMLGILLLCGAVFFFLLYFLLLTRRLGDYLVEISAGIRNLATGEFGTRIPLRQSNELTQIADNFNTMAEELECIVQEERRAENEKIELITSIAHDLRTPLTSVIGYLELVSREDLDAATREHYVSVAFRKAKRLQRLTDDLFNYVKFGSGQIPLELSRIDIVKMTDQLLEEFYPNIQETGLELSVKKGVEHAEVQADGMLLARAFANLFGNAIKYGRDGKVLRVILEQEDKNIKIRIINFGEVIPNKDIANIFERFYRVDAARTEEQGGTGLGLAIAKNIIELHRGTICVKSDFDGTEFTVELPVAE